jgi:hypothetical protein
VTSALILAAAIATGQSLDGRQPLEASTLRPGEIVRVFRTGGLNPYGLNQSLVAVYWDGTAIVKTGRVATTVELSSMALRRVKAAIQAYSPRLMDSGPKPSYPPSAADGSDIYLSVRKGKTVHRWTNVEHEQPERVALLEVLSEIEQLR